jgi:hypothetical protein
MSFSDEDEIWTAEPDDDELWTAEPEDDGLWNEADQTQLWNETDQAQPAQVARPRLVRPVIVLTALAGVIALAFAVSAILGWLPSHSIVATPGLAPAGTGGIRGAGSARPRPSRPPPAKPTPSAAPVPSTTLETAPRPVELSLAPYFNNIGIVSAADQEVGNIDGEGGAFSVTALAAAGARAGSTVTYHGVPFTWPDTPPGAPDNVVASGQTLRISGAGHTLAFLLTAGWGPATGTGEVVYSSGSIQKFTISAVDWWHDCSKTTLGEVLFTDYRYPGNGQPGASTGCIYDASVQLHAGQLVKEIVLPHVSTPAATAGSPSLHIFAITIH